MERIIHHPQKIDIIIKIWIRLLLHIASMIKDYYLVILILKFQRLICISTQLKKNWWRKTCFKNVSNPSYTDIFFTNQVFSFQNIINVATSLSVFHELILTVLKTRFSKNKPKQISYWDYYNFNLTIFHYELHHAISNLIIDTRDKFYKVFTEVLKKHVPSKRKLRVNHTSYVLKGVRKAIMKRSSLKTSLKKNRKTLKKNKKNIIVSRLYKK